MSCWKVPFVGLWSTWLREAFYSIASPLLSEINFQQSDIESRVVHWGLDSVGKSKKRGTRAEAMKT
jgi:hypothetical protein